MKKIFIAAVICIVAFTESNAQISFRPGIRGGVNFAHFTEGEEFNYYYESNNSTSTSISYDSKTDFYVGLYGALKLSKFYTLQPEIDFSRQGTEIKQPGLASQKLDVSYLSIAVANKFTFDKFNVHLGPTVDFVVENNYEPESEVDFAFFLGAGYNFTSNLGIEGRIKKGIIPVLDDVNDYHTNVVFSVGVTYTFDVKK